MTARGRKRGFSRFQTPGGAGAAGAAAGGGAATRLCFEGVTRDRLPLQPAVEPGCVPLAWSQAGALLTGGGFESQLAFGAVTLEVFSFYFCGFPTFSKHLHNSEN